jgi:hypothetical protein
MLHEQAAFIYFFTKSKFMELLSYGWLTEYMVHTNSPYKETMYGNFHECQTRSHNNAGQQYKRPETRNYIQLVSS